MSLIKNRLIMALQPIIATAALLLGTRVALATEIYQFEDSEVRPYIITDVYGNKTNEPRLRLLSFILKTKTIYGHPGSRKVLSQRVIKSDSPDKLPRIELIVQTPEEADCDERMNEGGSIAVMAPFTAQIINMPIYLGAHDLYIDGQRMGTLEVKNAVAHFTPDSHYPEAVALAQQNELNALTSNTIKALYGGRNLKGDDCDLKVSENDGKSLKFSVTFRRQEIKKPNGDILIRPETKIQFSSRLEVERSYYCDGATPVFDNTQLTLQTTNLTDTREITGQIEFKDHESTVPRHLYLQLAGDDGRSCTLNKLDEINF